MALLFNIVTMFPVVLCIFSIQFNFLFLFFWHTIFN